MALMLVPLVFLLGLNYLVFLGHNWARVLVTALIVLGSLDSISKLVPEFSASPLQSLGHLLVIAVQLAALYILFSSPGKDWFASSRLN